VALHFFTFYVSVTSYNQLLDIKKQNHDQAAL